MEKIWFVHTGGQQEGPLSIEELRSRVGSAADPSAIWAWRQGMENWKKAIELAELAAQPPAAPPPSALIPPIASAPTKVITSPGLAVDELSAFVELQPAQLDERTDQIDPAKLREAKKEAQKVQKIESQAGRRFEAVVGSAVPSEAKPKSRLAVVASVLFVCAGLIGYFSQDLQQAADQLLHPFPRIPEISVADYELLRSAAKNRQPGNNTLATVVHGADTLAPVLFLSSNLPDGTEFDVSLAAVEGSTLTSKVPAVTLKAKVGAGLWKSEALRLPSGEPIVPGIYVLKVSDAAKAVSPVEKNVLLLAGMSKDEYQAKIREQREQVRQRTHSELTALDDVSKLLKQQISATVTAFEQINGMPEKARPAAWKRFKAAWQSRDIPLAARFSEQNGPWTKEGLSAKYQSVGLHLRSFDLWNKAKHFFELSETLISRSATVLDKPAAGREIRAAGAAASADSAQLEKDIAAAIEQASKRSAE